ncbi:MAG: hypothetical protein Q8876_08820, partial [Bacillota bacterium]|nr:hypothetical protein [Bacillota bacterium]
IQMQKIQINSAIKAKHEVVSFKDSVGRVSGEYLWVFPPGVPLLVPGQIITKEEIQTITELSQDAEIISTFNLMPQEIHVIDE